MAIYLLFMFICFAVALAKRKADGRSLAHNVFVMSVLLCVGYLLNWIH